MLIPPSLLYRVVNQVLALLVIAFISITWNAVVAFAAPDTPTAPIARVNGIPIHGDAIAAAVEGRIAQYRQMGSQVPEDQLRRQFQLKELDGLIDRELLAQAGAALEPDDLDQRLAKRLTPHAAGDTVPADKIENLRKQILQEILLEKHGLLDLTVSEQELLRFYEQNSKSFIESRSVHAEHILVRLPKNATDEQIREVRQKAERILSELKQGKDFAAAAREYSDCSSKENGGDLGVIKESFMPREFDAVAFKLKPGNISDIVKTRHGLHIIKIKNPTPEKQLSFPEVKEHIAGYVKKNLQKQKINGLVQQLRKTAKIEIFI